MDAGPLRDLPADRGTVVRACGREVAVFVVDGRARAVDNHCLHTGGPLADGLVVDGCVVCPWHGWVYDLATGQKVVGHRTAGNLRTYPVVVGADGRVRVEIDGEVGG